MKKQIWLTDEEGFKTLTEAQKRVREITLPEMSELSAQYIRDYPEEDRQFGDYDHMVTQVEELAVVSINGALTNDDSPWNKYFGLVSYDEIRAAVYEAAIHEGTSSILLKVESPGGSVSGIAETSDFIKEVSNKVKPVNTYTGSQMASGGYWLGSVGDKVYANEMASVGSIGVITVHQDISKMLEDYGITTTILRKGEFKALGSPYEPLSDKAKKEINDDMDFIYDVFTRTVAENRGIPQTMIKDHAAEGKVFFGSEAKEVGLVDEVMTYDAVVEKVLAKYTDASSGDNRSYGVSDMKKRGKPTLTEAQAALVASGVPTDAPLKDGADAPKEGNPDALEPEVVADKVTGDDGADAGDVSVEDDQDQGTPAEESGSEPVVDLSPVVESLQKQVSEANDKFVDLKVELKEATRKNTAHEANNTNYRRITEMAVERMQIGMGGVHVDLSSLSDEALVEQFDKVNTKFTGTFSIGATAELPIENAQETDDGELDNQTSAKVRAVSFK